VRAWKPDPQLFLHAGQALGVSPTECAVIEDSELGIGAGVAAGMQVFAFLPTGGRTAHAGVHTIRQLSELNDFLAAP
jgi:beta-phosphoglucomutase-like phosphatase (HAD superfamily)